MSAVEAIERHGKHARLTEWGVDGRPGVALGVAPGGRVTEWVRLEVPARHASYLSVLRHPCAPRVMGLAPAADAAITPHAPGVSLERLIRAGRAQGGALEPELLACVVGRAGLGLDFAYQIARPPLRGVAAPRVRCFFDGQVRIELLDQLQAAPDFQPGSAAEPFVGGPAAPGEVAPFPARNEDADAFALVDLLHRALLDAPLGEDGPAARMPEALARLCRTVERRGLTVRGLASELILYAGRVERELAGFFRGLLEEEAERQEERAAELAMLDLGGDEPPAETRAPLDATVDLGSLEVERFPLSRGRYAHFLDATGYAPPSSWGSRAPPAGTEDCPVVDLSLEDARAVADFYGKRLPTDREWDRLAGDERYPWGPRFDETRADRGFLEPWTLREGRPLGSTRGDNALGVSALCCVWEWTSTTARRGWVVRGGPWRDQATPGEVSNRSFEDAPSNDVGVRLVRDG